MRKITLASKDKFTRKLEKPAGKTPEFSQLFMKLRVSNFVHRFSGHACITISLRFSFIGLNQVLET